MAVSRDTYYQILAMFRLGKSISGIAKEVGLDYPTVERLYHEGSVNPPRPSILATLVEEQRLARELALKMIREKTGIAEDDVPLDQPESLDLAKEFEIEQQETQKAKTLIKESKDDPERHHDTITTTATQIADNVDDRLGSVKYVRALKAVLSQQAPTIKKAMGTIERAISDIADDLPNLNTTQKLNVVSKLSGYIESWQGSVEAAIRLERLLLGEPDSHVAVTEMSQEDALKRLDRLRSMAAQANARIIEAEERRRS